MRASFIFEYIRPDEVAECWDGVSEGLYSALWACVPHYEDGEFEEPVCDFNCLKNFWHLFTPEQQRELNGLAQDKIDRDNIYI